MPSRCAGSATKLLSKVMVVFIRPSSHWLQWLSCAVGPVFPRLEHHLRFRFSGHHRRGRDALGLHGTFSLSSLPALRVFDTGQSRGKLHDRSSDLFRAVRSEHIEQNRQLIAAQGSHSRAAGIIMYRHCVFSQG
uniref:Uncharacterized protein n=1 Tax=Halomonas sp. ZM3 TaxID=1250400 RepID=K7SQ20_9GAMM|nr:hypothetical protein [Halomonas sp. ZM3]